MTTVQLRLTPLDAPVREMSFDQAMTVADILTAVEAPDWFAEHGVVAVNGHQIMRRHWKRVKIKTKRGTVVELTIVQGDKSTLAIAGSVALIAATGFIGAGGLAAFGGSLFAAGSLGASAAAAAVGIGGQLAIGALTAGPTVGPAETQKPLSNAGISGNAVTPGELLPVILGTAIYSPPMISRSYTTWDGEEVTGHAIYGVQGRCAIADVLVNKVAAADVEGLTYETREGAPGDAPLTLAQYTIVQENLRTEMANFRTALESTVKDELVDQVTPDNSAPDWVTFKTAGTVDEIWLRYMLTSGLSNANGTETTVAVRTRIRKVGDAAWRNLPTIHVTDARLGSGPVRFETCLKFETQPAGRHFSNADNLYPVYEITNVTGYGQGFEYQADAYFQDTGFNINGMLPIMTAATTSGVTITASSQVGGSEGWRVAGTGSWVPSGSLPQSITIDLGSPATIKSFTISGDLSTTSAVNTDPTKFRVEVSTNGSDWVDPNGGDFDYSDFPLKYYHCQIVTPGDYRYMKVTILEAINSASTKLADINLHLGDAIGSATGTDIASYAGNVCRHTDELYPRCVHGSLSPRGATFYLDPAQWLPGAYEVQTKRSRAFFRSQFDHKDYTYTGNEGQSDFFEYYLTGGKYVIRTGQRDFRSDLVVENFSSVSYDAPVDTSGIACIAMEIKNAEVNSVAATFSSYAPVWSDGSTLHDFNAYLHGYSGQFADVTQGAGHLLLTATASDPMLRSPDGMAINGGTSTTVEVVLNRVSGSSWQGTLYYTTDGHVESASYYKSVAEPAWGADWSTITFDMAALTAGGSDWISNTINLLRFDFGNGIGDVFKIQSIRIGAAGSPVWTEVQQITANPAALVRHMRLGHANASPTPAELIEVDAFENWYARCAANGHECNAVVSDMVVGDVEAMLGACGWATIRNSNEIGVIEDYDTSAEPVLNPLTPANSRNLGMEVNTPVLPHALRVQYFDESDNYAPAEVMVYRDGYNYLTATLIETRPYPGFTNTTRVTARALFDFRQLQHRATIYKFEVGREGMNFRRGMLTGITDPTLDISHAAAWVKQTEIVSGNVVSMTLSHIMPWGAVQGSIDAVTDLDSLADIMDLTAPMGVCIRLATGETLLKQVTNVVDSNTCIFTTPFPEAEIADGIDMVGVGRWGSVMRRAKVMLVMPTSSTLYTIECADEAPGLFT